MGEGGTADHDGRKGRRPRSRQRARPKPKAEDPLPLSAFMQRGRAQGASRPSRPAGAHPQQVTKPGEPGLIVNTNTASSTSLVVRRGKERVDGKKAKVTRVKASVMLHRSHFEGEGATETTVAMHDAALARAIEAAASSAAEATEAERALAEARQALDVDGGEAPSGPDGAPMPSAWRPAPPKGAIRHLKACEGRARKAEANRARREASLALVRGARDQAVRVFGDGDEHDGRGASDPAADEVGEEGEGIGKDGDGNAESHAPPQTSLFCALCTIRCQDVAAFKLHLAGKIHTAKLCVHAERPKPKSIPPPAAAASPATKEAAGGRREDGVDAAVAALLARLLHLQGRAHRADPVKAKAKKRVVMGMKEAGRAVRMSRCQALIVAPNVEDVREINQGMDALLLGARERDKPIPIIHALSRARLGRMVKPGTRVSVVSVNDVSGGEAEWRDLERAIAAQKDEEGG